MIIIRTTPHLTLAWLICRSHDPESHIPGIHT